MLHYLIVRSSVERREGLACVTERYAGFLGGSHHGPHTSHYGSLQRKVQRGNWTPISFRPDSSEQLVGNTIQGLGG